MEQMGKTNLDTLALRQTNPRLVLANDENIVLSCCERVVDGILDVDDVETAIVSLTVSDDTNTAHVTTASDHSNYTSIEPDEFCNLARGQVDLDGIVDLDGGIRVSDTINPHQHFFSISFRPQLGPTADRCDLRSSIMRNQEWDSSSSDLHSLDLAKFVFCLGLFDAVDGEAALGIVNETEVLARLLNRDDVHVASRIGDVGSDFAIDFDETLHQDGSRFTVVQGVLEAISEEDDQRETITAFLENILLAISACARRRRKTNVWPRGCLGGVGTRELVQKPVRRRTETLLMFLRTATHLDRLML